MVYSCAYFRSETDFPGARSGAKCSITSSTSSCSSRASGSGRRLRLRGGRSARGQEYGAGHGVTLSPKPYEFASQRIRGRGLQALAKWHLQDYPRYPGEGVFPTRSERRDVRARGACGHLKVYSRKSAPCWPRRAVMKPRHHCRIPTQLVEKTGCGEFINRTFSRPWELRIFRSCFARWRRRDSRFGRRVAEASLRTYLP